MNGRLEPVFTKLSALHTKNSFDLAIVAGNLFSEDNHAVADLLANKITIPLPTYFTVGTTPLPQRVIEKIEKDEEVRSIELDSGIQLVEFLLTHSIVLSQSPLPGKAKHNQDFRGHQNCYTWRTTRRDYSGGFVQGTASSIPYHK